jgi:uncharacterized coiled-coil protein SlyX
MSDLPTDDAQSIKRLAAVSKPVPERGTVPFSLADSEKLGQSPTVLKRLSEVESLLTFMQRTIDDLNQVVLEQAKRIERQDAEIARLRASLETLIGSIVEVPRRAEDERPPHY